MGSFAYSDPSNRSSPTELKNVIVERKDYESISSQARELFNYQTVFESKIEREWLLNNVRSTTIQIKVDESLYEVNSNYVLNDQQKFVLILHEFDETHNWTIWTKMIEPLSRRCSYSVILVDLPGFGQSDGRDLNQASWKRHGPEIIVAILSSFHIEQPVNNYTCDLW
ncbi:unnamed protein product [Rotaria sp. Silwood1]|nr:unnamed protein product [Rotaria sp. Silwood1]CAF1645672.1 unnamed protein product [Rotaria sp. Silwood1]